MMLSLTFLLMIWISVTYSDNYVCETDECRIEFLSNNLPIVILDYNDLNNHVNLSNPIEVAFGPTGLGILLVKNVPDLTSKRLRLLKIARELAHLDDDVKKTLEDPISLYSIGYSHGKEKLAKDEPDYRKMSYYGNPITNDATNGNAELIENYRSVYGINVWPNEHLPSLEESFMDLGTLIHSVGQLIAHQLDQYVITKRDGYQHGLFKNMIGTNIPKARLLYYFSDDEMKQLYDIDSVQQESQRDDNWCGWHHDHSALTGLILGMFFDKNGDIIHDITTEREDDELRGGLYIKTRTNITYHIELNEEESSKYLAFQIGETSQILSSGAVAATPHAVLGYRGQRYHDVSRASFAVFHQPHYDQHMRAPYHDGVDLETVQLGNSHLPDNVPSLASRWWNASDDTFGEFSLRTFASYY